MIIDTVESFLDKYNLLIPKNNIIVAFSGGYDSMCLLDVMKKLSAKHDLNIFAIHLNHNWRGEESDLEEERCRQFSSDINFYSEKLPPGIPHNETAARDARYDFFERCAKMFDSSVILTAHNANDNAETVFYRILKGTGITGLEGIRESRGIYYRPLLSVYRHDIENYCNKNNLKPNVDSSNDDITIARNKIRHVIFPQIPDIVEKLNELSASAHLTSAFINSLIKPLQDYSTSEFLSLDEYLKSSVVHKLFRDKHLDYDRRRIDYVLEFIKVNSKSKSGKTLSLSDNLWLFVSDTEINLISDICHENIDVLIDGEGTYSIGENWELVINKCDNFPECFPKDEDFVAYVNLDNFDYRVRTRCEGDIIKPLGLSGTQKLKKYFIGKHVPKHKRDDIILLAKNNEILWAAGVGVSEKARAVYNKPVYKLVLKRQK